MGQLLSIIPVSKNVSAGTLVVITCSATNVSHLSLFTLRPSAINDTIITHQNVHTQLTLSLIAPVQESPILIRCVIDGTVVSKKITAFLFIQGQPF